MKRLSTFLAVLLIAAPMMFAQAAKGPEFFLGKWSVAFKDLPNGGGKMIFTLSQENGKVIGTINDEAGAEIAKIADSESKENELTVYFTASGYDVNVLFKKIDDDHISGSLMGMFEGVGERVKASK